MTPAFEHVAVLVLVGVVAFGLALQLADAIDDDRAVDAGVVGDRPQRLVEDVLDDLRAGLLVAFELELVDGLLAAEQSDAAAGDDALFQGRLHGVTWRLRAAHLRSFISVSVAAPQLIWATPPASLASRSCSFSRSYSLSVTVDFVANLLGPAVDCLLLAGAADDRRVFGGDRDLLGPAEVGELDAFELDAEVLEDRACRR